MAYVKLNRTYYTPGELGKLAGVSRQTIVQWIMKEKLPATRTDGGHWRIPASVVEGIDTVERVPVVTSTR